MTADAQSIAAAAETKARISELHSPSSLVMHFPGNAPLRLTSDSVLAPFSIAYQTYGTLNADKSNAILICHALTGDQYVASEHPVTHKPGWWSTLVGPDKPVDTNRFFVICSNILGGCMGSTGPASVNPKTGNPYGIDFPVITIGDMVNAQVRLIDHLGISQLFSVIGGSMGGMQVLEWAARHKERVFTAIPIATAPWHSAQNIAFHEVGRQAVMADPEWRGGDYWREGSGPSRGLAVARMAAHITYLSEKALQNKFGRNLQDRAARSFSFDADFKIESYLRHQGSTFVDRFDANSYLYITRAMDYFDLEAEHGGKLANAFAGTETEFCVVSFTSDWLYPTRDSREIVKALNAVAANVSFVEIDSDKGHDAFLLEEPVFFDTVRGFLNAAEVKRRTGSSPVIKPQRTPSLTQPETGDRVDHLIIAEMVERGAHVLDIGAGDGALLQLLIETKCVDGRGIELSREKVNACVARGLSVIQGDADRDLADYPDQAFDYAVLSLTIQATRFPKTVIENLLRIGRRAIVSFPNFGHWEVRKQLLLSGRMPMTRHLPEPWYLSTDTHLCTIRDFVDLCDVIGAEIEEAVALDSVGERLPIKRSVSLQNLFGERAVFRLRGKPAVY